MQVLVVLAHPDEKSFNHAIAKTVINCLEKNTHTVRFHDLYAENFDPLLPEQKLGTNAQLDELMAEHCEHLVHAEGMVIIHPNWWGQPPAIMKEWIDRIFRPKTAYQFLPGDDGEGVPDGLLKAKNAFVINTSNTPEDREIHLFGDTLQILWKKCILEFCGIKSFKRKILRVIVTSTYKQRERWLAEIDQDIQNLFPSQSCPN
ncbi:NAD(P)H-dependent oxidoreductase [bacterium]|nr:NAD(P)H-dependent oxidoreductase [bacterium]